MLKLGRRARGHFVRVKPGHISGFEEVPLLIIKRRYRTVFTKLSLFLHS